MLTTPGCDEPQAPIEIKWGRTLTVKQAAQQLNCSISMVYRLMVRRELAYERRGRKRLLTLDSIAEYRRRNLVPAESAVALSSKTDGSKRYRHLFRDRQ
ncbi:MAG: helix-turn-helix domain-containing protein [Gemmataceae bacterium]|nr:helix-turn-helix domain-containing protein [Gemmataceae bacterium]